LKKTFLKKLLGKTLNKENEDPKIASSLERHKVNSAKGYSYLVYG